MVAGYTFDDSWCDLIFHPSKEAARVLKFKRFSQQGSGYANLFRVAENDFSGKHMESYMPTQLLDKRFCFIGRYNFRADHLLGKANDKFI